MQTLYRDQMGLVMTPPVGPAPWYAIQTRSNFEKRVAEEIAGKGFESFYPSLQEVHQWSDRSKAVSRPLFPGYVFARFFDYSRLSVIQSTGAVRIVGVGRDLASIPDEEIESVRRMLSSGRECAPHHYLREGALVRVRRGPLKDLEGVLVKVKNQTRLVLSVTLLCRSVATEVSTEDVEVIRMCGGSGSLVA